MSSCEDYGPDLSELFTGGLSDERRREVEEHVVSCPECRRRKEALRALFGAGDILARAIAGRVPSDLAERVRERIEAGAAREKAPAAEGAEGRVGNHVARVSRRRFAPKLRHAKPHYLAASLAAAAVLLLTVYYAGLARRRTARPAPSRRVAESGKGIDLDKPEAPTEAEPAGVPARDALPPRTASRVEEASQPGIGKEDAGEGKERERPAVAVRDADEHKPEPAAPVRAVAGRGDEQETEEPIARLGKVEGMVMYSRGVRGRWARAVAGVRLLAGDRLDTRTGAARLHMERGGVIYANRATLLRIFAAETDAGERTLAALAKGEIYLEDEGSGVCVETADGLFSPVGTRFNVKQEPSATLVVVADGAVQVRARPKGERDALSGFSRDEARVDLRGRAWVGEPVRVDSGLQSRVIRGLQPTRPVKANVARAVAWCGARTWDGVAVLYTFGEGTGAKVRDVSVGGSALDLTVRDPVAALWTRGALEIGASSVVASAAPATEIIETCKDSNAVTIEAWIEPATAAQHQDARIVSVSAHASLRNFTLMQTGGCYAVRLRTTGTSRNGLPAVSSPKGLIAARLTHVVYTRDASGDARVYVNGIERARETVEGDFSNWDETYRLVLANELVDERPWLGTYRLVAVYGRALAPFEVTSNWRAGPEVTLARR